MSITPYFDDGNGIVIYHGDARDILPTLAGARVDIVLTDPPYNVGMAYTTSDRRSDYESWCRDWFAIVPRPLVFTPGTVNLAMWYRIAEPTWMGIWYKPAATRRSRSAGASGSWERDSPPHFRRLSSSSGLRNRSRYE